MTVWKRIIWWRQIVYIVTFKLVIHLLAFPYVTSTGFGGDSYYRLYKDTRASGAPRWSSATTLYHRFISLQTHPVAAFMHAPCIVTALTSSRLENFNCSSACKSKLTIATLAVCDLISFPLSVGAPQVDFKEVQRNRLLLLLLFCFSCFVRARSFSHLYIFKLTL